MNPCSIDCETHKSSPFVLSTCLAVREGNAVCPTLLNIHPVPGPGVRSMASCPTHPFTKASAQKVMDCFLKHTTPSGGSWPQCAWFHDKVVLHALRCDTVMHPSLCDMDLESQSAIETQLRRSCHETMISCMTGAPAIAFDEKVSLQLAAAVVETQHCVEIRNLNGMVPLTARQSLFVSFSCDAALCQSRQHLSVSCLSF